MARKSVNGGGIQWTARLSVSEALKEAEKLKIKLNEIGKGVKMDTSTASTKNFTANQNAYIDSLRKARLELDRLKKEEQELINTNLKTAASTAEITRKIAENRLEQQELTKAARALREANKATAGSYKEAQDRLKALGLEIKNTTNGFQKQTPELKAQVKEYNQLNDKLKAFDATMGNHQRNVGNYKSALEGLKGLAANYLSAFAILGGIKQIVDTNAEISDSLSNVERTAGLTAKEADNLATQLKKIDTRTSLKGLIDIATIGGQLGIAKNELAGFTRAVDQLAVSLGGELAGGAEGIAKSLGVLDNVFGVTKNNAGDVEKSYNQIGSAILGLGQSGLATGDYLADFGERVGGVAKQAGLSLPVILSYGAVLQENGVNAEVAGTSFKKLLSLLATKRDKFFAVAQLADGNLTLKNFTNLINTDTKQALQLFFAGLEKGGQKTTDFMDILKAAGLAQGGVSQAVAALAGHQKDLNGHIQDATNDFDSASKSAEQFAIKNDNLAGSMEKFDNIVTKITTSGRITQLFKGIYDGATNALDKFNNLVNSESWKEFWSRLTTTNLSGDAAMDALKNYQNSLRKNNDNEKFIFGNGVFDDNKLKIGANQFNKYLDNVKKTYDQALDAYAHYAAGVENGLIKESNITVKQYKENAARANDYYKQLLDLQKKYGYTPKVVGKPEKQSGSVDISNVTGVTDKKITDSALNAQRSLQKEFDDVLAKARIKQLDADKQELADIDKKYKDLFDKAKEYNDKVEKFNADPKNKNKKTFVSNRPLVEAQALETDTATDKIKAIADAKTYDDQKKRFDDFENYKLQLGSLNARKLVGDKIASEDTYLQYLKNQENKLLGLDDTGKGADGNGERNQAQLKVVRERIKAQEEIVEKSRQNDFINAFNAARGLTEKLLQIDADYNKNKSALGDKATKDQLNNLERIRTKAVSSAVTEDLTNSDAFTKLFSNLDEMAAKEIDTLVKEIETKFNSLTTKFDPVDLEAIRKKLNEAKDLVIRDNPFAQVIKAIEEINKKSVNGVKKSATQIKADWTNLGKSTKAAFDFVNDAVQSADFLKEAIGDVGATAITSLLTIATVAIAVSTAIKTAEKASVVLAIISAALVVVQAIANVFKSIFAKHDKDIEKSIDAHKDKVKALADEYNNLERAVASAIGESVYQAQQGLIRNLKAQQEQLVAARNAELSKKKVDTGKVNEFNSQIQDAANKIEDVNKQISESLIQTNFKDLSNEFADAITDAYTTAANSSEAFDKVFNKTIANAIKNSLKLKLLEPVISDFTNALGDYAKNNNNSVLGFDFDNWKAKLEAASKTFAAGLKGADEYFKDPSLTSGGAPTTAVVGTITSAGLSEDTANKAMGVWRGTYDQTKITAANTLKIANDMGNIYQTTISNFNELQAINANTLRTANNTDNLEAILKKIDNNTKSGSAYNSMLGAGVKLP